MAREIVLDTETTGLDPRQGHRVIEIACVEIVDLMPTGRFFHRHMNPERDIDPDAERIHGLSRAFLEDKPLFGEVVDDFLEFVGDAPLIAHNAGFDRGFVNHELARLSLASLPESRWIDTLSLAQKRFPGMYNSLDALCKRFKISLAEREKHGALVDTRLLALVYLELNGGREARLDLNREESRKQDEVTERAAHGPRPRPLPPRLTAAELASHEAFVAKELKGSALWLAAQG